MQAIEFNNLGKKYIRSWVYQDVNGSVNMAQPLLIQGGNGSGKSTLLKTLAGIETPSVGSVLYKTDDKASIPRDKIYKHLSICTPYQSLYEELSLAEHLSLYKKFKKGLDYDLSAFISLLEYPEKRLLNKRIEQFSSGMKQRIKIALALFSTTPIIFLDEPTSNLDAQGITWYQTQLKKQAGSKLLIIASNDIEKDCLPTTNIIDLSL